MAVFLGFGRFILKTSTFLVSMIKSLFFPGNIFSVIFSPCFINLAISKLFRNFVDCDLFPKFLVLLWENLFFFRNFGFFNIYLHHLCKAINLLISCLEAYAHLFLLKLELFNFAANPLLFFKGLS